MCANVAGGLLLVGSADGSLTLDYSKLDTSNAGSSRVALHDMWAGEAVAHGISCAHHAGGESLSSNIKMMIMSQALALLTCLMQAHPRVAASVCCGFAVACCISLCISCAHQTQAYS